MIMLKMREVKVSIYTVLSCAVQILLAWLVAWLGISDALLLMIDAGLLFVLGLIYSTYIAVYPFRPRFTWLSVADGCAFTNTATSIALYVIVYNLAPQFALIVSAVPWLAYGLSGLSMISFQYYKYQAQDKVAKTETPEEFRDDA